MGGECVSRNVNVSMRRFSRALLLAAVVLLAACATPSAPEPRGRWMPVNRFTDAPQAIPLQQSYIYQASPVDGTLKTMLARWAKDSRMQLSYLHGNDYTLHAPIAHIRTSSLEEAAAALSSAYADQGVQVVVERPRIIVSQRLQAEPSAPAADAEDAAGTRPLGK